jgi:hypothetical protein
MSYDLHLLSSSPANGAGTSVQAPLSDMEGRSRTGSIAAGAYTSSYGKVSAPF